jgi:subtilisin-like proprotein convertase family protein
MAGEQRGEFMKRTIGMFVATTVLLGVARVTVAQTKTVTGEAKTVTATVESIEQASRTLTLKQADGTYVTTSVPDSVKRFSEIKVGDTITAKYYENLVIRLKLPSEKDVNSTSGSTTPAAGAAPGGTVARQWTITATIATIDQSVPSITFTGPNGWKYSSRVEDKKALAKVKVGDKVDITYTEAVLVSLDAPGTK